MYNIIFVILVGGIYCSVEESCMRIENFICMRLVGMEMKYKIN